MKKEYLDICKSFEKGCRKLGFVGILLMALTLGFGSANVANATIERVPAKVAQPKTPTVKAKSSLEGKVTIKWNKIKNADYYEVYRSTNKCTSIKDFKKIATTKKHKYTDKKAKKRTTYYYKVRAFNKEKVTTYKIDASGNATKVKTVKKVKGSKYATACKIYVRPKTANVVIIGECYGVALANVRSRVFPSNYHVVGKSGLNSYQLMYSNCISYGGTMVTPLERAAYYNPDRIYLLIGMNECKSGTSKATIYNFSQARKQIQSVFPHCEVVLMAITPVGRRSSLNIPPLAKRLQFNRAYASYAASKSDVYYYDYTSLLDDGSGYIASAYGAGDGCHWNSTAALKVAKDLYSWDKKTFLK